LFYNPKNKKNKLLLNGEVLEEMKKGKMPSLCIITTIPGSIMGFYKGQLEAFKQAGFEITVICADDKNLKGFLPKGTNFYPVPFSRVIDPLQDIKNLYKLLKLFRREKYDIVQYSTPKASLLGSVAAFFAGIEHRIYILWGLYYTGQKGIKHLILKSFEKIICKLSNKIIPISHEMIDFALKEGLGKKDKYEVILNGSACGVDMALFDYEKWHSYRSKIREELQIPEESIVIGTVARLTGDKGINELVQAFDKISKEASGVYLLLVGKQEEKDRLLPSTANIISKNLKIHSVGQKNNPLPYYATMDIFCLPTYREGFGEVNLEAQAMRIPVVSTNVIGPRESVEDGITGFLVEPRSSQALLEPLRRLIENPELRHKMGIKGQERVKKMFDRKDMIKAVVEHRLRLVNSYL
jgi:glycosyltransferase involved in cell wall biosynthesis